MYTIGICIIGFLKQLITDYNRFLEFPATPATIIPSGVKATNCQGWLIQLSSGIDIEINVMVIQVPIALLFFSHEGAGAKDPG